MRMQSPASTGLLPATYSRRRRTRPNESLTYREIGEAEITSVNAASSPRRSTSYSKKHYESDNDDENDDHNLLNNRNANNRMCPYEEGYEDVLPKPPTLTDFLVNDRNYQMYLIGGKRGAAFRGLRGNGVLVSEESSRSWYSEPVFLAKLCAGASFVGMVFLIYIALIIELQPLYIKGIPIKQTNSQDGTYRFRKETSNALKAAAAYFLTMVLSLIYLQVKDMNLEINPHIGRICHLRRVIVSAYFRYRRRHYDDIPDGHHGSSLFGGVVAGSSSLLPMHNNGEDKLKSRRRKKNSSHSGGEGSGGGGESAIGGIMGKLKSWGIGGGGSSHGRKKDR
ncbi:predicted protein [Thalassiosira pseudonana CCMP1335]|uniref:Uncharacterized protein n=1 Tax=Thalassiosira pseudonana TaxID=35128 RepID=B8BZL9_THAPS|nr:predicted protein [Thalassiosira pseudonana CCMP1335]EED93375.1 predicted protein [Thalassiosira pseudonana CCMP1335]|eukprot:g12081.t1 g12081   contig6:1174098-1175234(+)